MRGRGEHVVSRAIGSSRATSRYAVAAAICLGCRIAASSLACLCSAHLLALCSDLALCLARDVGERDHAEQPTRVVDDRQTVDLGLAHRRFCGREILGGLHVRTAVDITSAMRIPVSVAPRVYAAMHASRSVTMPTTRLISVPSVIGTKSQSSRSRSDDGAVDAGCGSTAQPRAAERFKRASRQLVAQPPNSHWAIHRKHSPVVTTPTMTPKSERRKSATLTRVPPAERSAFAVP
jgi:hypothetical protein